MIEIREIEDNDASRIAELSIQLGYESRLEQSLTRIRAIKDSNVDCAYVAVYENKVVGWIHVFYTNRIESDPFVEIAGLVVDSDYRNLSIGKKLIHKVNEWAKTAKVNKVFVRCNAIRTESHKFYEKIGFKLYKQQMIFEIEI